MNKAAALSNLIYLEDEKLPLKLNGSIIVEKRPFFLVRKAKFCEETIADHAGFEIDAVRSTP
jgi:hypothetical protein